VRQGEASTRECHEACERAHGRELLPVIDESGRGTLRPTSLEILAM
jgi:hypothetical protein